jgi:transposase
MAVPVPLREDFDAAGLRGLAKRSRDGPQSRRLLALAVIYDGATRSEAAKIGGVGLQIIRDWVLRFNARGPDGLLNGKSPGQPAKLNDSQRQALARMIESGPIPAIHGVVRWRLIDLVQWVFEEFRITVAKQTLSRELRAMGYRKLSARPRHHARAEGAIEDLKKLPGASGRDRAREGNRSWQGRNLVPRRSSHRPKEQDHPAVGQARHPSKRAPRPAYRLHLHLRRGLSEARQGRGLDPAGLQHRGDEPAPCRGCQDGRTGDPRRPSRRSSRMAPVAETHRSPKHHNHRPAAEMPRTQPGRKHLGVYARQLALKPSLQILRRSRRPLLPGLEQADRQSLAHHVHRLATLGAPVLINENWYKRG